MVKMSSTSDLIKPIKVLDSELDIKEKIPFPVASGASSTTAQSIAANARSSSNVSWNVVVPNESTVISRYVLLDVEFTCQFDYPVRPAGGADGNVFRVGVNEAPAPFPFQSAFCTNIQAFINNTSVSAPLNDLWHVRWGSTLNEAEYAGDDSMCPYKLDDWSNYSDAMAGRRNPLAGYDTSAFGLMNGRGNVQIISTGGGDDFTVTDAAAASNTVRFRVVEPLFLRPFLQSSGGQNEGLIGVNSLNISMTLNPNSPNFWSIWNVAQYTAAGATAGGNTVGVSLISVDSALLRMKYMTLSSFDKIPLRNSLPIEDLTRYVTGPQVIANNARVDFVSNNIQLGVVPSRIFIAARPVQRAKTQPFGFMQPAGPSPLQVTFDNKSSLLSELTVEQLYHISKRNGYNRGLDNFRGYGTKAYDALVAANTANPQQIFTQGAVVILDPALDLSLDSRLSTGCTANINLQIRYSAFRRAAQPIAVAAQAYELIIVIENDGCLTTVSGSSYVNSALLDSRDVVEVKSKQKGCSSDEVAAYQEENWSASKSDALASKMEHMSMKGSGAASGGAYSGGEGYGARSGGKKEPDLDSLLF
jgi:hypothetical protein